MPFHAAQAYVRRLVKSGKRVAIAEQMGEPVAGKLTDRQISQVISRGHSERPEMIESDRPLHLAAVFADGKRVGLAYVDHTTGLFRLTECEDERTLDDELARVAPAELLFSVEQSDRFARLPAAQVHDGYAFLYDQAFFMLKEHFKVQSLDGFGCAGMRAAVGAAGAILHYLRHSLQRTVDHLRRLQPYRHRCLRRHRRQCRSSISTSFRAAPGAKGRSSARSTARPPRWVRASCASGSCGRCARSIRCARARG